MCVASRCPWQTQAFRQLFRLIVGRRAGAAVENFDGVNLEVSGALAHAVLAERMRHDGDSSYGSGKINHSFRSPGFGRQLVCSQNYYVSLGCADFYAWNNEDVWVGGSKFYGSPAASYAIVVGYRCNFDVTVVLKYVDEGFRLNN